MMMRRRDFLATGAAVVIGADSTLFGQRRDEMFGLITKISAVEGKRDELIAIMLAGAARMPGCLCYVVAKDSRDENSIWITEAWTNEESHAASLTLPSVKEAITKGRPLIAGFGERVLTTPVGGQGLS
jgi:quinol monooxygenase YgiN